MIGTTSSMRSATDTAEAIASLKTETRRYAKRQVTWFRHQMADWPRQLPEESA